MRTNHSTPHRPLLLIIVALVGLNLRPFLTAIGPLTSSISEATGLDFQSMSLFTVVPMVLMGVCAFAGPWLQRVVGSRRAVIGALVVLCVASAMRLATADGTALIATAALCGLGVAIIQAVFPGIVKVYFPGRVAIVMGLYSSMLMGGGALGAQLSPIIADLTGSWHLGLAWIAIPAALAALVAVLALPSSQSAQTTPLRIGLLLSRPRAWLLMACFGLVNGGYSSVVAWLAPYYQSLGWTSAASGSLLAAMATSQAISALSIPVLAARWQDRRPWIGVTLALQISGFAGLVFWPELSAVGWAAVVGAGLGGCFALFMIVALDHLDDPAHTGALSALMQGGGFLIAAIPPWIASVLHDLSGSFVSGWLMHLACATAVAVLALRFAPHSYARSMNIQAAGTPLAASGGALSGSSH
jgi:MFS transporter, CP family, cyanate transporter